MTSCGIEYEHTFAVVDFGSRKPNYEIILDRPFMRQLKMIQDWGYNYIYLRQPSAMTRIDLRDHSFKDVVNTPVKDMVSTIAQDESVRSWLVQGKPFTTTQPTHIDVRCPTLFIFSINVGICIFICVDICVGICVGKYRCTYQHIYRRI